MRIHEKWPTGHGVDLDFWNKQKLWHLCDAAAISLGVDPRVMYSDAGTKDRALHGGPKLAQNEIPGLVSEIENLVIMAMNGLLPVLKNGFEDADDKAWWCIRPADYRTAVGEELEPIHEIEVNSKSKASYLRIIAALCAASGIDWKKEGAASKIAAKLDLIGEKASPNTIRKILNEISEIVDSQST
ncbi:MAG: hypothetical protein EOM03_16355 [Clostridia bacterium]|nr:hypothetical protein [Clostridia bacterium]